MFSSLTIIIVSFFVAQFVVYRNTLAAIKKYKITKLNFKTPIGSFFVFSFAYAALAVFLMWLNHLGAVCHGGSCVEDTALFLGFGFLGLIIGNVISLVVTILTIAVHVKKIDDVNQ